MYRFSDRFGAARVCCAGRTNAATARDDAHGWASVARGQGWLERLAESGRASLHFSNTCVFEK